MTFTKGEKYTVYRIDDFLAMTSTQEITVKDLDPEGNAIYSLRGKRKRFILRLESRSYASAPLKPFVGAVFRGWDQPIETDVVASRHAAKSGEMSAVMRGNACFNFVGKPEDIRAWIEAGQLNPHFRKGTVIAIEGEQETPVYPEIEAHHAVIARLKEQAE